MKLSRRRNFRKRGRRVALLIESSRAYGRGLFLGSRDMFAAMNRAISLHQLKPVMDRCFPFGEAPAAYRYQETGAHFGKVVVSVSA